MSEEITVQYIHTKNNVVNIFTKALLAPQFMRIQNLLGMQWRIPHKEEHHTFW